MWKREYDGLEAVGIRTITPTATRHITACDLLGRDVCDAGRGLER